MTGEDLKKRLKTTGRPIAEIARELDVLPQSLNQALNVKDVKTGLVENLSRVLNLPIGFFFGNDSNGTTALANGDSSVAAINSNVSMETSEVLQERVKHLEELIAEKERLIQVLMKERK